jgi:hypothetical protein
VLAPSRKRQRSLPAILARPDGQAAALRVANRAARRRLRDCARLDPRFAADIGLAPDELAMECRAPFWVTVPRNSTVPKSADYAAC